MRRQCSVSDRRTGPSGIVNQDLDGPVAVGGPGDHGLRRSLSVLSAGRAARAVAGFVEPRDQLGQAFLAAACGHYLGAGLRERLSRRLADRLVAARDRRGPYLLIPAPY
jgi:hypothetical protein